ncbi:MAG TPA: rhomboid family intramembrane serine protease [Candidatus Acidoferrum sp.]|nr:rhomboid family intramembrane serine protease [Candidatus Acidoferrum sp.]
MIPIRDTIPTRNPPIATWLVILANCLVFLLELSLPEHALAHFFYQYGLVPARYTHPAWALWVGLPVDDYFPFLTSMFLHGGWLHIIGNMWALWIFGDNVEDRMGPIRFVFFYLLCGFAAGLVHWLTNPHSTVPTVGASGAIAGVMGAYLFLFPRARLIVLLPIFFFPFFFELPAVTYLGFWALTQVFSGTLSLASPADVGGVAWWGHVGGFGAGILLQFLFVKRADAYRRPSRDEYGIENAWVPVRYWRDYP